MGSTVLLFESRDLCYESNRYFIECMAEAFEGQGYPVEICDLSLRMQEQLYEVLERRGGVFGGVGFYFLFPPP